MLNNETMLDLSHSNLLDRVSKSEETLFREAKENIYNKRFVNLNGGARLIEGFTNIDPYYDDSSVINCPLDSLPYLDNTVDVIYSSYLMESFDKDTGKSFLKEWSRVLKLNSGKLYMSVPDMGSVCVELLNPNLSDSKRIWYQYLVSGDASTLLVDTDKPFNLGDMVSKSFTKPLLLKELWDCGFKVKEMFSFEGGSSPSIWVEASV